MGNSLGGRANKIYSPGSDKFTEVQLGNRIEWNNVYCADTPYKG